MENILITVPPDAEIEVLDPPFVVIVMEDHSADNLSVPVESNLIIVRR